MITVLLPLLLASAAPCSCPAGVGGTDGVSRILVVPATSPRAPGLVVCGYAESNSQGLLRASEFEVFSCGTTHALLTFDALQAATLRTAAGALEITEVAKWPFGRAWQWIDVPLWRHLITPGTPPTMRRELLLSPPALSQEQIASVLRSYADAAAGHSDSLGTEELIGRVFSAALAGDVTAQAALAEMRDTLRLDGAYAEAWHRAIETYQLYARITRKVSSIPGV